MTGDILISWRLKYFLLPLVFQHTCQLVDRLGRQPDSHTWEVKSFSDDSMHLQIVAKLCVSVQSQWQAQHWKGVLYDSFHWGQKGIYPVGTLWVYCGFWNNSPGKYPLGKLWALLKSTYPNTQWVHCEQTPWFHSQYAWLNTQWVFCEWTLWFHSQCAHQCAHWAHCKWTLWSLLQSTQQNTQRVFCEQTLWFHLQNAHQGAQWVFLKQTPMVLSQNTQKFNYNVPSGLFTKYSQ